jgi:mono/diheme cytochrome c family protein
LAGATGEEKSLPRRTGKTGNASDGSANSIEEKMKKTIAFGILALAFTVATSNAVDEKTKALYKKECTRCHGDDGKGDTKMGKKMGAKDYTDPEFQKKLKDETMFKIIKEGLVEDGKTKMKPATGLKDEEIKGLVAYMRTFAKKKE